MTRIIETLDEIGAQYRVLYCDLWGVLHDGRAPFRPPWRRWSGSRRGAGPWC
jgi:hypothetical protein